MKKLISIVIISLSLTAGQQAYSQVSVGVDYNTFYTTLSPYGRWVDYPQYGHVWICNEPNFRPYYDSGHWEYSADGWTWVSDYPWGWAPFHYGRWAYIDGGWGWVPGYDWAPAWVSWCDGGDYYGWAPLGPGIGISISINSIPADRWCFVPHQYINSPNLHNYYVDRSRNADIYRHAAFINNIHAAHNVNFVAGPRRADVERFTHTRVPTRPISYSHTPGRTVVSHNAIKMYRPGRNAAAHPANNVTNRTTINRSRQATTVTHTRNNNNITHQSRNNQHAIQQRAPQQHVNRAPIQNRQPQQHQQQIRQPQQHINAQPMQQHVNRAPVQNRQPQRMPSMQHNPGAGGEPHQQRR